MVQLYVLSLTSVPFSEVILKASEAENADVRLLGENGTCCLQKVKIMVRVEPLRHVIGSDARVTTEVFCEDNTFEEK